MNLHRNLHTRIFGSRARPVILLRLGRFGAVAQLGEHLPCTQGVVGSNPIRSITAGDRCQVSGVEYCVARRFLPSCT